MPRRSISVDLVDIPAVRRLSKPSVKWRRPEGVMPFPGTPDWMQDPAWPNFVHARQLQHWEIIREIAGDFLIEFNPQSPVFWTSMTFAILSVFPAFRIMQETRGRHRRHAISDADFKRIERATKRDRKRIVGEVAKPLYLADSTVDRLFRAWRQGPQERRA
jgi:hypothetical protein